MDYQYIINYYTQNIQVENMSGYIAPILGVISIGLLSYKLAIFLTEEKRNQIIVDKRDYERAMKLAIVNKRLQEKLSGIQQPLAEMQEEIRELYSRINEISAELYRTLDEEDNEDEEETGEVIESTNKPQISTIEENSDEESEDEFNERNVGEIETPKNTIYLRSMKRGEIFEST